METIRMGGGFQKAEHETKNKRGTISTRKRKENTEKLESHKKIERKPRKATKRDN